MKVLIALEQRFFRQANGYFYGDGPSNYSFWKTYLDVFDEVVVLARVSAAQRGWADAARADGPSVSFSPLPDYYGPWGYLRNLPELTACARAAVAKCDSYILRVPGLVGRLVWRETKRLRRPYALQLLGDPWDALGPRTWPSVFRPLFRRAGVTELKRMCQSAAAIHYVTAQALQARYPGGKNAYTVGFSDALMDSAFAPPAIIDERLRRVEDSAACGDSHRNIRIGFVGSLCSMYKGADVLLQAAARCRPEGLAFDILIAGTGRHADAMKASARWLGIADRTHFVGQLPVGNAIIDFLDSIDLFVMPSRAEGLPRALLEAMARGCPAIGSAVGGIPELLASEDLVPAGNVEALAQKIMQVARDPQRLRAMSRRNFQCAKKFSPEILQKARQNFYDYVRNHSVGDADGHRIAG